MIPRPSEGHAEQRRNPTIPLFAALLTLLAIVAATLLSTNAQAANPIENLNPEIENPEVLAWRLVPAVTGANLRDVHMVSATDGWAVGENGTVLRYDGTSWSPVNINPQPSNETLVDVHMLSATDGYIGGWGESGASGTIYRWNGTSWGLVYNAPRDINRIDAVASNDVWASGVGQIYHYNGTSWTLAYNVPEGPNVFAIQMVSANEGWAVGANQLIAHYLNGSWTILDPSPAPYTLYDSFFTAPNDGWAVGFTDSTYVMHYDGVEWTRAYSPTAQLSRMYFLSATDGWAISYSSILHYDGTDFTEVNNPYPDGLNSVYMLTPTDGWIVGTNGAMLHYSDDATATPTVEATATATAVCGSSWNIVPISDLFLSYSYYLNDIEIKAADDIWAVGYLRNDFGEDEAVIFHWDGSKWDELPRPIFYGVLTDVASDGTFGVWAVGYDTTGTYETVTMFCEGIACTDMKSPGIGDGNNYLQAVEVIAPDDVWVVGYYYNASDVIQPLAIHWDGTNWTITPTPNVGGPSSNNHLFGVAAASATDVWAVGSSGADLQAMVLHWNGSQWSQVVTPTLSGTSVLYKLTVLSADNIWAAGGSGGSTLVEHWDGTQWSVIPSPNAGAGPNLFTDIAARSSNDIWAVGFYANTTGGPTLTLTAHWDGIEWSIVPSPNPGTGSSDDNSLQGVDVPANGDTWAVGNYSSSKMLDSVFTLRYSADPCATASPTPSVVPPTTATATSAPATSTPVAPTATPSPCTIEFADVPSTNTFYTQVRCLACRGIMGGYADNTFRPNNDITRGQLSKIVANSAGFNEPVSAQTFEDVEPDNAFYVYVERMAGRGIIGGYTCGGAGEPCGPENKPYFRPNANATRGQISKIVSEAKGYGDPQTGQTFEDVAVGSTFHLWIERLASRGIMGGYACGGAGEPCGTGNKPYFRPNAKATRGQTSKIVANTFFPGCQP